MKSPSTPRNPRQDLLSRGLLRYVSRWLLSTVMALCLVFGQAASAGPVEVHHPHPSIALADFGQETAPAPACHPGIACTAFVLPEGPVTALTLSNVIVLRPDVTQSQRRIGGPSVTLPPPRSLT